mgnify:CR=1 FL=1|jgi:hypothetical protein
MIIFYSDLCLYVEHSYTPGRKNFKYFDPPEPPEINIEDVFLNEQSIYDLLGDKQLLDIEELIYKEYED